MIAILILFMAVGQPILTASDFACFLNKYAAGDAYANCDGSTGSPTLTANDFQCFLNRYAAGDTYADCDGSGGWTPLPLPPGAMRFHVAPDGDDQGPGSIEFPFRSVARGYSSLRDGHADQLMLQAGGTWNLSQQVTITKGGSPTHYQVIGSYGTGPRPRIIAPQCAFRGESIGKRRIAFVGLDIVCSNPREDSSCIILLGWKDILIEGCHLHQAGYPLVIQGFNTRSSGVRVRRNVISDANYPTSQDGARAVGLYMDLTDDWDIEENVFDRCGIPGSMFGRPVYVQSDCGPGTFRGNIMGRSPAEGVQVRSGGIVDDNLSLRNPIGIFVGNPTGGTSTVTDNVVLESGDISEVHRRGVGIHVAGGTMIVRRNVLGYNTGSGWGSVQGFAFGAEGELTDSYVYDWTRDPALGGPGETWDSQGVNIQGGSGTLLMARNRVYQIRPGMVARRQDGAVVSGGENVYHGNISTPNGLFFGAVGGWTAVAQPPDPMLRELLPGGGIDPYMDEARKQSPQNWRIEYTAAGFNAKVRKRL